MLRTPVRHVPTIVSLSLLACLHVGALTGCGKPATPEQEAGAGAEKGPSEANQPTPDPTPAPPALTQAELEAKYIAAKTRFEATAELPDESFAELKADLMRVANEAEDRHLRANASLLLGALHEARNDERAAISFYRQAQELIPEDAGPYIVLALALSKAQRWDEAIAAQWKVVELIPDDLVGWLLLGELNVKGGKLEEAAEVYGAYELRRMGLLDGLTLKRDGEYVKDEAERVACAEALAPAVDNGTALALMYALDSDSSAKVREQIAAVMGEQRLLGYKKLLETKLATEQDPDAKAAIEWAIAEIQRDPIDTAPGPVPESLADQVKANVAAAAAAEGESNGETSGEPAPAAGATAGEPAGEPAADAAGDGKPAKAGEPGGEPGDAG